MPVLKTSDKNLSKHLSRFRTGTSRIHKKKVKPRKSVLRWLEGQQENVVFLLESGHSCPPNLPLFKFLGCLFRLLTPSFQKFSVRTRKND